VSGLTRRSAAREGGSRTRLTNWEGRRSPAL